MPGNPLIVPVPLGNGANSLPASSTSLPISSGNLKPSLTKISAIDVCDEEGRSVKLVIEL